MPWRTDNRTRGRGQGHGPPTDSSGRDLLGRMRALAESVRRQLAARRQNRARPGGPKGGVGGR